MTVTARVRRPVAALLVCGSLGFAVGGCGTSAEEDFAAGWDGVCADVTEAYRTFRTDVASAATSSPDAGDASAARPLPTSQIVIDLGRPARKLERSLREPLRTARTLDPPGRWQTWHQNARRALAAQATVVFTGLKQVEAGDADRLPSLALGGIGPSSVRAPSGLRDQTPACTALR